MATMPHIFIPKLINGDMHGTERPAADLLFDDILVDSVLRSAVIYT